MNAHDANRGRLLLALVLSLTLLAGCGGKEKRQFGEAAGPGAVRATLAEIVARPESYEGKTVVVEGKISGGCGDGCLLFKDKLDMIEADPPDPEVTRLKRGTTIRLYGTVKVRREGGGEAGEKWGAVGDKNEPAGKGKGEVRIVARGAEVVK